MKALATVLVSIVGVGALLTACEDADQIELTGPALEEALAATSATPDASPGLRITGTPARYLGGEPLIFIDGVRVPDDKDALGDIEATDIEKVTVIRGTKAVSLYGPDAEHGVILITLKDSISK